MEVLVRYSQPTRRSSEWLAHHAVGQFGSCWRASYRSPLRTARVYGMRAVQNFFLLVYTACLVGLCSCASLPETPKSPARVLPPETTLNREAGHFGLLLLPIAMEGGEPLCFAVDTGAPYTLLDASFEPRLGKSLGRSRPRSTYGLMPGHFYRAPALLLNGTQLQTGRRIATADLSRMSEDLNRITQAQWRVMGVLGMDCLGHYCIQLDFTDHRVRFLDSDHLNQDALGKAFPLTFSWNAVYVNQNLLGRAERTRIDTGANFDGELKSRAFRQWSGSSRELVEEHGRGWFAGEPYSDLCITADGNCNVIGLRFLARHLVTFDFPSRMMYLKRMPMRASATANKGQALVQ